MDSREGDAVKNWSMNMDGVPAWLLVLVALAGVSQDVIQHVWPPEQPTLDADACANHCYPYGLRSASTTACECEVPSRYPAEVWRPRVDHGACDAVCGEGEVQSYSPVDGCVCIGGADEAHR